MIIVFEENANNDQIQKVTEKILDRGFDIHRSTGTSQIVFGVVGDTAGVDTRDFSVLSGVHEVIRISEPYKLASRASCSMC